MGDELAGDINYLEYGVNKWGKNGTLRQHYQPTKKSEHQEYWHKPIFFSGSEKNPKLEQKTFHYISPRLELSV